MSYSIYEYFRTVSSHPEITNIVCILILSQQRKFSFYFERIQKKISFQCLIFVDGQYFQIIKIFPFPNMIGGHQTNKTKYLHPFPIKWNTFSFNAISSSLTSNISTAFCHFAFGMRISVCSDITASRSAVSISINHPLASLLLIICSSLYRTSSCTTSPPPKESKALVDHSAGGILPFVRYLKTLHSSL